MSAVQPVVELENVSKDFGGTRALDAVTFAIEAGTVHGLVGENGAGKSTLGKIIAGAFRADTGIVRIDGHDATFRSPRDALKVGVTMMAQEIALVPKRSVLENVFLGTERARSRSTTQVQSRRARYRALVERAGFHVSPDALVRELCIADQQKVEILRALARDARLIVMDEPTAALTADESAKLFDIIRSLREAGTTIVYVSHFLHEVLDLVDDVTVLKDGRLVRTSSAATETPQTLVRAMLGRSLELAFPPKVFVDPHAPEVLRVEGLRRGRAVRDVSLRIHRGEIVGLAGLVGSGRSEVARCIFGADRTDAGEIFLDGRRADVRSPRRAIAHGIAMLPESRKDQGLLMRRPLRDNMSLAHTSDIAVGGIIASAREASRTSELARRLDIRGAADKVPVTALSGGNQQKALFAKWLFREPKVFIADEPTRGVDVGAKQAIYQLIVSLAQRGLAVLLISSDFEEVVGLAHRVLVMRNGSVVAEFDDGSVTEDLIMHAAFASDGAGA